LLRLILRELPPGGRRFLLPCAEQARFALPAGLREAGGRVDTVVVYRTLPAAVDGAALRERLIAGGLDALTFTSPSAAKHFVALLDEPALAAARRCVVAAIGPVTCEALSKLGLAPDCMAERASGGALVDALATCFEVRGARSAQPAPDADGSGGAE
jgi:uroporphyrinogen III methyltransferase/synthase